MNARDGGPAFPGVFKNDGDMNVSAPNGEVVPPGWSLNLPGMSLRDYFAAAALQGLCSNLQGCDAATIKKISGGSGAVVAYAFADSMLLERARVQS